MQQSLSPPDSLALGALLFCASTAATRLLASSCLPSSTSSSSPSHSSSSSTSSTCSTSSTSSEEQPLPYEAGQAAVPHGASPAQVRFQYRSALTAPAAVSRARAFSRLQNQRRSLRFFDPSLPVPAALLDACICTAGTAPSGAHQQPWHFSVVRDPEKKAAIREVVEREEQLNYDKRMKEAWKQDLEPIFKNSALHQGGRIQKPYLTDAPCLVVVTELTHGVNPNTGERLTHHYVKEGVGIAVGLFLAALTNVGLFSLTSTPLNAGSAICSILARPTNEKVFLLMPVGYPAPDATVPFRDEAGTPLRKALSAISTTY